jgi:hypothetical protein
VLRRLLAAVVKPQKIVKTVRFQTLRSSLFAQQIKPLLPLALFFNAEAKFIVPDSGDIVISQLCRTGCRTGPPAYVAWRACTATL